MKCDVAIVGAGPAGLFAALELTRAGAEVLLLEGGDDLSSRESLTEGWGGAGAYSDGKLTLSPEIGGHLLEILPLENVERLISDVDRIYREFGAPDRVYGSDSGKIAELARSAFAAGLKLVPSAIRHMGTDGLVDVLQRMRDELEGRTTIRTNTPVRRVLVEANRACGVETSDGERLPSRFVVLAPGRSGSRWLAEEALRLGLTTTTNPVDIGLRVEVPSGVLEPITSVVYEPKLVHFTRQFDDRVRTFCVCPHGEVVVEGANGIQTVNGRSYEKRETDTTNFAVLVSARFTSPFQEPIRYGEYLASLANMLSGGVIVQRLGDLDAGRRSTESRIRRGLVSPTLKSAVPGDLSFVLPYRQLSGIREMLDALDTLSPGVASRSTLLYGLEVKFYSSRVLIDSGMETDIPGLFAIGDGSGITRGLVQASASGLIAARKMLGRG